MRIALSIAVLLTLSLSLPGNNPLAEEKGANLFSVKENIVMFYYKDISQVAPFYEQTLGLSKTFNEEWAKIYRLTPTSFVGVIQESEGGFHKAQPDNAVMLSIVTEEVDGWYEHLKRDPSITFVKEIYNNEHAPIRAFLIRDPGGYTIEFFQWLETEKQK